MRVFGSLIAVMLLASVGFAQYTMELTSAGNVISGDVYVSPYQGNIWADPYTSGSPAPTSNPMYSGYVICDDYTDESNLYVPWNATATNAADVGSSVLFTGYEGYTQQQTYNAVAWLANQLLSNLSAPTQTNISFAIWNMMDNNQAGNPDGTCNAITAQCGGAAPWITQAFMEVTSTSDPYVGSNVTVFTPAPKQGGTQVSQEFLVVGGGPNNGPLVTPEPASVAILGVDLLSALGFVFLLRRYRVRA